MEDNTWKMREIVRKIEMMQSRMDRLTSFLNKKIDEGNVSDDLLRTLLSPTEELEWRLENIEKNIQEL